MDSLITAAARALAAGDPLGALKRVALREDAPGLALRGIAMAQLGEHARAKLLLRRAARVFGTKEPLARARCVVAEAEVALVSRDLNWPTAALEAARATLHTHGDWLNVGHAQLLAVRRLLLIGRLDEAERALAQLDPTPLPPALRAAHELAVAGIALRHLKTHAARAALTRAHAAAHAAGIPALLAEVAALARALDEPAACLITRGEERLIRLDEVEALASSTALIVDACRYVVRHDRTAISLAKRPVLFALLRSMAQAWPQDLSRADLIARAFRAKRVDESHRVRLRVELGRLRRVIRQIADLKATPRGYALVPHGGRDVLVLTMPVEDAHAHAPVLALLADGESWASSALAMALGASQRTVQRALDSLYTAGKVQSIGDGRARRWMTPPVSGFATSLLLPTSFAD